jgi:hypothetical protein
MRTAGRVLALAVAVPVVWLLLLLASLLLDQLVWLAS